MDWVVSWHEYCFEIWVCVNAGLLKVCTKGCRLYCNFESCPKPLHWHVVLTFLNGKLRYMGFELVLCGGLALSFFWLDWDIFLMDHVGSDGFRFMCSCVGPGFYWRASRHLWITHSKGGHVALLGMKMKRSWRLEVIEAKRYKRNNTNRKGWEKLAMAWRWTWRDVGLGLMSGSNSGHGVNGHLLT